MRHLLLTIVALICSAFTVCASDNDLKVEADNDSEHNGNILTIYFSCTGNTEAIAQKVHSAAGGELLAIEPVTEYTSADLNYNTDCRANREQNDPQARPAIKTQLPDMADYDVVFLGYPIWWGKAPKIIYTLLESADFSTKTIIPFCTSGSSPITGSEDALHALAPGAHWVSGHRFASNSSQSTVTQWVNSVLEETNNDKMKSYKLYITVNGTTMTATMEANSSTAALRELLKKGDVTIDMSDYGNFEKVGELPVSLPQNNKQITTTAGDLILYLGRNFVIYYDTNSWNFTPLGKIDNMTQAQLKEVLGKGDCTATLSLAHASLSKVTGDDNGNAETIAYNIDGSRASTADKGLIVEVKGNTTKKTYRK